MSLTYNIKKMPIPFRYPGGKFYALNILAPYWLSLEHDEYREPFVGGGSVFFTKQKSKFNILNDADKELIMTYQVIQNTEKRLVLLEMLEKEVATKERWREIYNFQPQNEIEIAYKYYYLNRTSFSGKLSSPGWGYRDKRSLPPERWHERIIPCGEKLQNVDIISGDFAQIIDQPNKGKQVLLFVDPPYFSPPKKKHYRNGFNYDDHLRLVDILKKTKHKFFLTYDDIPEIRELYKWANINDAQFIYRVDNSEVQNGKRKMGLELVITNYEPVSPQLKFFN